MTRGRVRGGLERLRARAVGLGVAAWLLASAGVSRAADELEDVAAVALVTAATSDLRAGPGLSYRVIHRAERGESFPIQGREGAGFWLRVYLSDGRTAYLLGDTADPVAVGQDGGATSANSVFSPPLLSSAWGGMSMSGGVFDGSGYAEIRPAFVINSSLSIEPYVGLVLASAGRSLLYGGAATINLTPDWAISPFVSLGGGGYSARPNDDAFVLKEEDLLHAKAGGGLLVSLRWRISLRLEASHTILFDAETYRTAVSYVGGLGSYF